MKLWSYSIPPYASFQQKGDKYLVTTPDGGFVAMDDYVFRAWRQAHGRGLDEIRQSPEATDEHLATLVCLCEGQLLERNPAPIQPVQGEVAQATNSSAAPGGKAAQVSVLIVGYNSKEWLEDCLESLFQQTYSPIEVIFIDNASTDGSFAWVNQHYPQVRCEKIKTQKSLAHCLNHGKAVSSGDYCLLLNPDVILEPAAIEQMVGVAQAYPKCAAVAAKLMFLWARSFVNGLGNRVQEHNWGADNYLGYLDLGQFADSVYLPSACFAAALILRDIWDEVGPLDENFPMYYEDTEWCYRARLLGYDILAAPRATIYHAFGSRVPTGEPVELSPKKRENAAYGRLRFANKLLSPPFRGRLIKNYFMEDWRGFKSALRRGRWHAARAYPRAWGRAFMDRWFYLRKHRAQIQAKRQITDAALFSLQENIPAEFAWRGLPLLTFENIQSYYLPLLRSRQGRDIPEARFLSP